MTSTTAVGGTTAGYAQQGRRPDPMQAVTDLLGGDKKAVFDELRSGKSLDDIAKEKGVSHTDLTAAIAKGLPADGTDAADKAEQIASTKGLPARRGGGHHHGPPPASSSTGGALGGTATGEQQDRLDRLSSMLGTDAKTLLTQLTSGTTLTSLAAAKGVDPAGLTGVLQSGDLFDRCA